RIQLKSMDVEREIVAHDSLYEFKTSKYSCKEVKSCKMCEKPHCGVGGLAYGYLTVIYPFFNMDYNIPLKLFKEIEKKKHYEPYFDSELKSLKLDFMKGYTNITKHYNIFKDATLINKLMKDKQKSNIEKILTNNLSTISDFDNVEDNLLDVLVTTNLYSVLCPVVGIKVIKEDDENKSKKERKKEKERYVEKYNKIALNVGIPQIKLTNTKGIIENHKK
ncbi:hypothetical protein ACFL1H_04900, partial [Nanoarchaeota archaeon]